MTSDVAHESGGRKCINSVKLYYLHTALVALKDKFSVYVGDHPFPVLFTLESKFKMWSIYVFNSQPDSHELV